MSRADGSCSLFHLAMIMMPNIMLISQNWLSVKSLKSDRTIYCGQENPCSPSRGQHECSCTVLTVEGRFHVHVLSS